MSRSNPKHTEDSTKKLLDLLRENEADPYYIDKKAKADDKSEDSSATEKSILNYVLEDINTDEVIVDDSKSTQKFDDTTTATTDDDPLGDLVFRQVDDAESSSPEEPPVESDIESLDISFRPAPEEDLDAIDTESLTDDDALVETDVTLELSEDEFNVIEKPTEGEIPDELEEAELIETTEIDTPDDDESNLLEETELIETTEIDTSDDDESYLFEEEHPETFVYNVQKTFTKTGFIEKFKLARYRIGIDIGTYALKYIKTLEAKNTYLIEEYGYYKYPVDVINDQERMEKHVAQVLKDILSQEENKKARINIIAKGSDVGIKSIKMPKMAKKNMVDAVRWATQKSLSFSEGETITDFLITGEAEEDGMQKNEILVISALDSLIHENLDRIPGKKIPHKVTLVPIALWQYIVNIYATIRKDNIMVIDIGHQTTMINVLNKRNLKFAREVGVAGREFTKVVAGSYTNGEGERILVNEEEAEHLKIKYGIPESGDEDKLTENGISLGQISSRLKQSVEKLIGEIERSINFYIKEFALGAIEQIYLCGGSAALKNIDKLIYQALDIKTEVIDLLDQWTLGKYISDVSFLESCAPALVVPAGLAMDTSPKLNLLPRELFNIIHSKYIKNTLRVYTILVAVILFSVSTLAFVNSKSVIKQLLQEQETVNQLGPQQKRYLKYKDEYNDKLNKISILKKNLSESTIDEQVLIIMSNLMPENVVLTSMLMDKSNNSPVTSVNFSGYIMTDTFDANVKLAEFIYRLQNSAYMKNITLKKSQAVKFHSRTGIFFEIIGNVENYEA